MAGMTVGDIAWLLPRWDCRQLCETLNDLDFIPEDLYNHPAIIMAVEDSGKHLLALTLTSLSKRPLKTFPREVRLLHIPLHPIIHPDLGISLRLEGNRVIDPNKRSYVQVEKLYTVATVFLKPLWVGHRRLSAISLEILKKHAPWATLGSETTVEEEPSGSTIVPAQARHDEQIGEEYALMPEWYRVLGQLGGDGVITPSTSHHLANEPVASNGLTSP